MDRSGYAFADAVRAVAGMRQAVASGVVGAVMATGMAYGVLVADAAYAGDLAGPAGPSEAALGADQAQDARRDAEYYLHGLAAIAGADLRALPPREAMLTIKAMARTTLDNAPPPPRDPFAPQAARPAQAELDAMAAYLVRVVSEYGPDTPMPQDEADAVSRLVRSRLKAQGIDAAEIPFTFAGVAGEMGRSARFKADALREIVRKAAEPGTDVRDLVMAAREGAVEREPADRALLSRMADHWVAHAGLPLDERAGLARDAAVSQAADGAFAAIERLSREDGTDLDPARVGRIASVALANMEKVAEPYEAYPGQAAPAR